VPAPRGQDFAHTGGYVTDAHATEGCGCSFYWPGEENKAGARSIFSSEDFSEIAWMNLNGKDVQIRQGKCA